MISLVYCTRETNPKHKEHLIKTSGLDKNIEIIEIINNGNESLTKSYNRGLKEAKNNIVVFCHDDLNVETKQWGKKLIKLFNKNPEFGIIGVAGTKYMSENGKWWDNSKKMYGRVSHTHEGKTWLSSYSDDLGQEIEEVIVVDGVFFAINKSKIKKEFNENVDGYHFYDVTFCFENFLEKVKIGVTTIIRINHASIGMTNDSWEKNREDFSNNFKNKLPISLRKKLRKGEKLRILLTSLSFDDNSSKSKHILELASILKKENHDVTICANMQGKIPMLAKQRGIKLAPIQQPPGFALGDGKWTLKTTNGEVPSQPNTLYKVKDYNYSTIHTFDNELIDHMNKIFPNSNIVNTKFENALITQEENPLVKETIVFSENIILSDIIEKYIEGL